MSATRAAMYLRVSTFDQTTENQAREVRVYVEARGWTAVEYVDEGVSGTKESRQALDQLLADARRRKFDVVVVWSGVRRIVAAWRKRPRGYSLLGIPTPSPAET